MFFRYLGHNFCGFRASCKCIGISLESGTSTGTPQIETTMEVEGLIPVPGVKLTVTNTRLLNCKPLLDRPAGLLDWTTVNCRLNDRITADL